MSERWFMKVLTAVLLSGLVACGPQAERPMPPPPQPALRVGLSLESPPIAFELQRGRPAGIEVDLAGKLAADLGRPLRLVPLLWDDLVPALLDDRIDVIMSGMTVTRARGLRVAFGDPYLKTGLVALVRRSDAGRYRSPEAILNTTGRVGVVGRTTGEKFARERLRAASVATYSRSQDAVTELRQGRIDLYISDAHLIAWFASEYEADLVGVWTPLTDDALAWAFRLSDEALRTAANRVLASWKADGTLDATLRRWLRVWPDFEQPKAR